MNRETLLNVVEVDPNTRCWEWLLAKDNDGYGKAWFNGRWDCAHRVAYELFIGPIPTGMHVLHRCDNPPCVSPEHLFTGSHADNMKDKVSKCRQSMGEKHSAACTRGDQRWNAKLTRERVAEIRCLYASGGITMQKLAEQFGVTRSTIGYIVRADTWVR